MKVLTEQEVSALKSEGWDLLDTTFDITYKGHWGMWHAIREFVQNALDEHDEVGITQKPRITRTSAGLVIEDDGRGLGARALLMRETKRAAGDLRGQFGEGLKLACIATLRADYEVLISSPHFMIRPIIRERTVAGETFQLISFLFKNEPGTSKGTKIVIKGYYGTDYLDRFFTMGNIQGRVDVAEETIGRFSRILSIATKPPNRLYVGDIYVRELGTGDKASPYSYNLWNVALNPDRDAEVSSFRLSSALAGLWIVAPRDMIPPLLRQVQANKGYEAELSWDYMRVFGQPTGFVGNWQEAWNEVFGSQAVLWTNDEWARHAESFGYRPVRLPHAFANYLSRTIESDEQVVVKRTGTTGAWRKEIPDAQLSPTERAGITEARAVNRLVATRLPLALAGVASGPSVNVVAAEFSTDPNTGVSVAGLWQESTRTVSIQRSALSNLKETLEILFHELGHWISGGGDLTAEHANGVAMVAVMALEAQRDLAQKAPEKPRERKLVAAGPIRQVVKELGWADLAAQARAAGIPDPEHWSKATLRKMLSI